MKADERDRVCREVWRRMGEWEADDGHGSARPQFVAAWATATRTLSEPATPHDFEAAWQRWLRAGTPLTTERAAELLAAARRRGRDGQLFAERTTLRRLRPRVPGEEG